jgi:polysaccharide biosynthesis protein PslH
VLVPEISPPLSDRASNLHFLFVKTTLAWPRSSGHDVHSYGMMRALQQAGHQVSLLTRDACSVEAVHGLELSNHRVLGRAKVDALPKLTWLQARYCSFWGIDPQRISEVRVVAEELQVDVVVAVGLDILPYLAGLSRVKRVWYAADEWVLHHLTQFSPFRRNTWGHVRDAAIKGVYERAFANRVDRVWVVSKRDALATRMVMHRPSVDIIVNGVDANHFAPQPQEEFPLSCVFWGRLDFGPNIDAVRWFAKYVWPQVKARFPAARFGLFGFQPGSEIEELAAANDIELRCNMPDIRSEISKYQVVVLPFVSGAGIKNKLLEAAALSRPILASRVAMNGVERFGSQPCRIAQTPKAWVEQLEELWSQARLRSELGTVARDWVMEHYTWNAAAELAVEKLSK